MATLTLHPVRRGTKASNRYCGPSAISILTGLDTRDTARLLRSVGGRSAIKGTHWHEMSRALIKLGFRLDPCRIPIVATPPKRLTLIAWLKRSRAERGTDTFLLGAGHHYAVVQGRRYACGQSKVIVSFKDIPHRCARMEEVYKVVRVADRVIKTAIPPRAKTDPALTEAKKLAAHWNIELEPIHGSVLSPSGDGVFVYPPVGLYENSEGDPVSDVEDPLMGQRGCYSWSEVLEAINVYIDAVKARDLKAAQSERPFGQGEPVTFVQS